MSYTIDVYCNDGSPLGLSPPDIYTRGVGGAELSLITWAETMAKRGHSVTIYNNPIQPGTYDEVRYCPQGDFKPREHRDVFIAWRSPNQYTRISNAEVRLFWSTDQYTVGNFATDIFPLVDRIICISPFHVAYHKERYGVENGKIGYFDLGVRQQDYCQEVEKISGRCIFCSVPERGLSLLRMLWPRIKEKAPHASLVITSDYTLWGSPNPLNHQHRLEWMHSPDVHFLGKVDRLQLAREQLQAEVMPYPCTYEELFCISAAECQIAGAYPVTSPIGALKTTNQWGTLIEGNMMEGDWQDDFISSVVAILNNPVFSMSPVQGCALERFNWDRICGQWEHLIETGAFQ